MTGTKIFSLNLKKELNHSLDDDLLTFRNEITGLLEDEIMNRYFYEEGSIAWSLKNDEQVLKAIDILNKESGLQFNPAGEKGIHSDNS